VDFRALPETWGNSTFDLDRVGVAGSNPVRITEKSQRQRGYSQGGIVLKIFMWYNFTFKYKEKADGPLND